MRLAFILVTVLLLAACNNRLIYQYADWWIEWKIDDFVELSDAQETQLEKQLKTAFQWHADTQLPLYQAWLIEIKQAVNNKDINQLDQLLNSSGQFWRNIGDYIWQNSQSLLLSLSVEQRQQLINNIAEFQKERHQKWLEEAQDKDPRENLEQFEYWLGELSDGQQNSLIAVFSKAESTLAYRIEHQQWWLSQLQLHLLPDFELTGLNTLLFNSISLRKTEHVQINERNRALIFDWLKANVSEFSAEQMAAFNDNIDQYIEDLSAIMAQQKS